MEILARGFYKGKPDVAWFRVSKIKECPKELRIFTSGYYIGEHEYSLITGDRTYKLRNAIFLGNKIDSVIESIREYISFSSIVKVKIYSPYLKRLLKKKR